jgi:pyruvate/2-oxoglutarate dehydrogenase complex dihydrolipoamide acyltransferase (E2) component
MREAVRLPPFGEGVAAAEFVSWLVAAGSAVRRGQDLAEVQTAKATLTVAAPADGVLAECVAQAGTEYEVGAVIGWIAVEAAAPASAVAPANVAPPAPANAALSEPALLDAGPAVNGGVAAPAGAGHVSPRLRRRLSEWGLSQADLALLRGSGRDGRVQAADLERFIDAVEARPGREAGARRLAIADAMQRSWARPLATVARRLDVDPILKHRRSVAGRPNLTVYAVRALARVLAEQPELAGRKFGKRLLDAGGGGIAVAVAFEDGLVTPVVAEPGAGDLAALSTRIDEAIDSARRGRPVGDPARAAATITNYGSLNLTWATPIPPPEQSCILGLGAVQAVPVWDAAAKGWGRGAQCEMTLTFDHRVADGAVAANVLHRLATLLQKPECLVAG